MAESVGITASVLATITAAIQSTNVLKETVRRFKERNKTLGRLQNELEDLSRILDLVKHTDGDNVEVLALLQGPINRCSQLCHEFEDSMNAFSAKSRSGFRDWARMEFMKGDINEFIDILAGYKSTISIGLGTITMHASKVSDKVVEEYNRMIEDTSYGLQEHLQRIDEKLAQLTAKDIDNLDGSIDLKDERGVTKECLCICEDAMAQIKSLSDRQSILSPDIPQSAAEEAAMQKPFEAQQLTRAALDENRRSFAEVIVRLEKRLEILAVNMNSSEDNERIRLHEGLTSTLEKLGNIYRDQGKLREAKLIYQRALLAYEKALGLDHISTLDIVSNLGDLYRDQGMLREAKLMYQRALVGYEKALGLDHTSTLNIVSNLGNLYKDQGKLREEEESNQGALAGHENAPSPDNELHQPCGNNSPNVSDSASVVTDFSYSGSLSSTTTINKSLELGGIEVFVQSLFRHGNFKMLCDDALEEKRIQRDRLRRNLVKLLRVFASNLSREKADTQYANIPKFIRRYSFSIATEILANISDGTIDNGLKHILHQGTTKQTILVKMPVNLMLNISKETVQLQIMSPQVQTQTP
ncbi:hypothetical protein BJY00DRAFT_306801 [Aspergillus carlsbadensis]|nr:hypothetical protein BJY00DRAFT_306801 [Aspergillus carlsbadensis]